MNFLLFWKAALGRFVGTWIVLASMWSFNLTSPESPEEHPENWPMRFTPLKEMGTPHGIMMGTAVNDRYLDELTYTSTIAEQFNLIVAENAMKFNVTHPHPTTYAFDRADRVMAFAEAHDLKVRGHTLIWYGSEWVRDRDDWTEESLKAMMADHITTVVGRYKGKIAYWDVVNEAISGYWGLRRNVWTKTIGETYIDHAFRVAHETDPEAKLFYNDFRVEGLNPKANRLYELARRLLDDGVPVHGVGLQAHLHFSMPRKESMIEHFQRLADLGLEIHLTEIDLGIREPISNSKLIKQAIRYRRLTEACMVVPACTAMVFWGFTDRYSWIPKFFKTYDAPLLFDTEYKPKIAYFAIADALMREQNEGS